MLRSLLVVADFQSGEIVSGKQDKATLCILKALLPFSSQLPAHENVDWFWLGFVFGSSPVRSQSG